MSNWTEEQQEQYEQGNDGGYTPPKGSLDWAEQPAQPEPAPKGTEAWTEQNSGGNAPEPSESKEPPKTDVAPPADKPAGVSPHNDTMGYEQQIAALQEAANRVKPETEEERKKRERREKSAKIVSAVSDGLQALSNLFFTTRGAPNMYDHKEASQLTPLQEKLEKLKAERQANADKYLQYSLKIGDAQNERAKTLREMEAQQERSKLAREKAQREQEEHGWLAALQPDKQREQAGKATKAEQEAVTAKAEADNAPDLYKAKVDTEKARGEAQRASAASSRAAATDHYASARAHDRSNNDEFSAWDENGHEHKFRTAAAAEAFAKQHGTFEETDVTSTSTTDSETNGKSTTTYKKKSGYAKRVVPDNTPPSRRRGGNNDNTPPSRRR
ncbi:hypothetical protein [Leyella stercorea]|uniref:hypothetical protein n=1 Tax=Leyella stercorea TaxID=363265 RepID=UPI00242B5F0D|nr:hypothetical protein [Leyella stercorea]